MMVHPTSAAMNGAGMLLDALSGLRRWVAWTAEQRAPDKPPTKVPYAPSGRKARSNDPKSWGVRAHAQQCADCLSKPFGMGGVGFELGDLNDGRAIGGLDLDRCRADDGTLTPWANNIIRLL